MLERLPVVARAEGPMWRGECFVQGTRFGAMVMEKRKNLDLATKADIIGWVQAGETVSAAFLAAFLSTITAQPT